MFSIFTEMSIVVNSHLLDSTMDSMMFAQSARVRERDVANLADVGTLASVVADVDLEAARKCIGLSALLALVATRHL